jgi:hypothetical protein
VVTAISSASSTVELSGAFFLGRGGLYSANPDLTTAARRSTPTGGVKKIQRPDSRADTFAPRPARYRLEAKILFAHPAT